MPESHDQELLGTLTVTLSPDDLQQISRASDLVFMNNMQIVRQYHLNIRGASGQVGSSFHHHRVVENLPICPGYDHEILDQTE